MAASRLNTLGPTFTVVDAPRLARVASWQDQWTPGTSTAQIADAITLKAVVPTVTGNRVGITVDNQVESSPTSSCGCGSRSPATARTSRTSGPSARGRAATPRRRRTAATAASSEAIAVGGPAGLPMDMKGTLGITSIEADGRPVSGGIEGAGWIRSADSTSEAAVTSVQTRGDALEVGLDCRASRPSAAALLRATSPRRCRSCRASTRGPTPSPAASRRPARTSSPWTRSSPPRACRSSGRAG